MIIRAGTDSIIDNVCIQGLERPYVANAASQLPFVSLPVFEPVLHGSKTGVLFRIAIGIYWQFGRGVAAAAGDAPVVLMQRDKNNKHSRDATGQTHSAVFGSRAFLV